MLESLAAAALLAWVAQAAVATLSYSTTDDRHVDAKVSLLALAGRLERHHVDHHSYAGAAAPGWPDRAQKSARGHYTLRISQQTDERFVLQAVPLNADGCGTFTLSSKGERGNLDAAGAPRQSCW